MFVCVCVQSCSLVLSECAKVPVLGRRRSDCVEQLSGCPTENEINSLRIKMLLPLELAFSVHTFGLSQR